MCGIICENLTSRLVSNISYDTQLRAGITAYLSYYHNHLPRCVELDMKT